MVNPSRLQISFVSTWKDGMHFSKGLTFANKEVVKHALIIYTTKNNRNFTIRRSTKNVGTYLVPRYSAMHFGHSLHALLPSDIAS